MFLSCRSASSLERIRSGKLPPVSAFPFNFQLSTVNLFRVQAENRERLNALQACQW
jgi:hypothetical protein